MSTLSELGSDIAGQMLSVLVTEGGCSVPLMGISINEQKEYLVRNIDKLAIGDRRGVAKILALGGYADKVSTGNGCVLVNLDMVDPNTLTSVYDFAVEKISNRK